jgi:hypothetical protein
MSYVHLEMILDRSGSMQNIADDTIGGVNRLLADQRQVPGDMTMSLRQFDDVFESVFEMRSIKNAPDLTKDTFVPRGQTALLDAIGRTIKSLDIQLAAMKAQPDHVILAIVTDGLENASREYSRQAIMELITARRAAGWEFVYIGSNEDGLAAARDIAIPAAGIVRNSGSGQSVNSVYASLSGNMNNLRSGASSTMDWAPAQRDEAAKKD